MAAITWEELIQKGGGNIHYLFTVAGYPWAVTDHPDVKTLLNDGSSAAKTARQTIFGSTLLNSPELLTDGDMEASGTSAWSSNDSTLSKETTSPKRGVQNLKITATAQAGSQSPWAAQTNVVESGKTYRARGWARSDGTHLPEFVNSTTRWQGTTSKEWQYFDEEFTASSGTIIIGYAATDPTGTEFVEFDHVSVKEVTTYPAESTTKFPIFTTLQKFSGQKFSLNETRGEVKGGGFSIEISDEELGHQWSTTSNVGNTDSKGLVGVHAIAQPRSDTAVGYGTLHETCAQASTTLTVYEQDGGTLDSGVPDGELPDSEYRLLWVDQECVAASSVMPNSDEELTDGDMEKAGVTDWGVGNGATLTKDTTNPHGGSRCLRVTRAGDWGSGGSVGSPMTIGKKYVIKGWARGDATTYPAVWSGSTLWTGTSSTSWQYYKVEFTCSHVNIVFYKQGAAGNYTEFDDVSIKEVASSNDITLSARGIARSRDADHFTSFFDNVTSPLVLDTPPSIIDKPCTVWAIGLESDGSAILTQPVIIQEGVVGADVGTKNGITRISVLSVFERLNTDFQLPKYDGQLGRYIFYRGDVGVLDTGSYGVVNNWEMPHLVICERALTTSTTADNKHIWLCARNSSVEFDSPDEVLAALADELGKCAETYLSDANKEQVSGDATVGYVTTTYKYEIREGKIHQSDKDGSSSNALSFVTGPLAFCFNLGSGPNYTTGGGQVYDDQRLAQMIGSKRPWFMDTSSENLTGAKYWVGNPWLNCLDATNTDSSIGQNNRLLLPHDDWVADYYYSYEWNENFKDTLNINQPVPDSKFFRVPKEEGGSDSYLYIKGEEAATQFIADDEIALGNINDEFAPGYANYGKVTVNTIAADSGYTKLEVDDDKVYKALNTSPFSHGRPLFSMKALDLAQQDTQTDSSDPNYDMWQIGYRAELQSPSLGKIFRAILNDPNHGQDISSINQLTFITGLTTEGDFVSIIDWDDLDEKTKYAREALNIGDYKLNIAGSINLYSMLKNEIVLHGLSPTYEWDQESGQFRVRFRHLAPLNATQAAFGGRVIDNTTLIHGHTTDSTHNDAWLANSARFQSNYDNGRFYRTYNITYNSGFAMNRKPSRSIRISSVLSHIGADKVAAEQYFSKLIYHFAQPSPVLKSPLGLNAFLDVALGREVSVTDETARNPYDHELGLTNKPGLITAISYDWINGIMNASYRLSDEILYGYAPACYVTANNSTKGASSRITCQSELHEFSNITDRVDCMWFGCYNWNSSTNTYAAKSCSCGEYKILAFERYKKAITPLSFNVYTVASSGEIVIEDQDGGAANYTAWDVTKNYVLVFADWDSVESCQQDFVYFADDSDTLGSGGDRGRRWG
jgi:hypothetical protein